MRAFTRERYGPPEVLALHDLEPPTPGPGEAVVRVRAASLNMADLDSMWGRPRIARVGTGIGRPRSQRVGLDVAGIVESVGPGVTGLQPGDAVWADMFADGMGSFGEAVCARAAVFSPMPTEVGFEPASTVPHSGLLALQGLLAKGPVRPGDRALVIGGGGCVGPFAIQIAKAMGAVVTGVDHGGKLELMSRAGADHVIDYTVADPIRGGGRYDLILDIAATRSVLAYRRVLAPGGRYVLIAKTIGGFFSAALLGWLISIAGSKRMGVFTWRPNHRPGLDQLAGLLRSGAVRPIIDRTYPLAELPEALTRLDQGLARGKLVVTP